MPVTAELREQITPLVGRMTEIMDEHEGLGIAAIQVGVPLRLFVARVGRALKDDRDVEGVRRTTDGVEVYLNPSLQHPLGKRTLQEGCLSFPGVQAPILRHDTVTLAFQGLDGNYHRQRAQGLLARVWQHEFDHCNGLTILEWMGRHQQKACQYVLDELYADWKRSQPARGSV